MSPGPGREAGGALQRSRCERGPAVLELDGQGLGLGSPSCSSSESRSWRRHSWGKPASSRARASAAARAPPGATTRLTRPMRSASTAPTGRPVSTRSRAREAPIRRGSRTVPPSISGTPQRRQKTPSTASSAATLRSHHAASSSPPATAYPSIAATTGLPSRIRVGPIGASWSTSSTRLPCSPPTALRSAPAQNVPPSPHSTATDWVSSASKARKAAASAAAVGPSTALRACGRWSTTVVTGPSVSTRTAGALMPAA